MSDNQTAARQQLNAEAESVMNSRVPTPTQAENDAIALGQMHPDDKQTPDDPQMPPLHEQQAMIAKAADADAKEATRHQHQRRPSPPSPPPHARSEPARAPASEAPKP